MSDGVEDVLEVIAQQIEERFQLPLPELGAAIAAAPEDNAEARDVMYWYGLLAVSQSALERSENELLAALGATPDQLSNGQMDLAHRVNAAVASRDGRAMVVRHLLDPGAPGKQSDAIWRGAARSAGRPTPLPTTGPAPHPPGPARGMSR